MLKFNSKLLSSKVIVIIIILSLPFALVIYFLIHNKKVPSKVDIENEVSIVKTTSLDQNQLVKNVGDVEKVVTKWIEANPEAILQAVASMQKKAMEKQRQDAQKNVNLKKDELINKKEDPVYLPKKYDVSIVEFFDYNCGFCKKAQKPIEQLINEDQKIRIIFKELPILGPSSVDLSKVAIAVNIIDPKIYFKFHNSLMKGNARTKEEAISIAESLGINISKLKEVMESKKSEIDNQIKSNQELASSIGINGTPAFIIGEELVPGMIDINSLKEKVSNQR